MSSFSAGTFVCMDPFVKNVLKSMRDNCRSRNSLYKFISRPNVCINFNNHNEIFFVFKTCFIIVENRPVNLKNRRECKRI